MTDEQYIAEALQLAEQGRHQAHPNPLVGAVVVKDGTVVGRGYHRGPGTPHAEAAALAQAGAEAGGATLFCTLEPCCSHGRTPPCTEAIVAAGVSRVVAALSDPNPAVDGKGFAALRAAGIEVALVEGDLHRRAQRLAEPFARFVRHGLPLITYKAAVSLDGKTAAAGGDARWISGPESRRTVHAWRARADAVLVGAGTVRHDDPALTARDADGPDPLRIVATRTGDLPLAACVVRTAAATPTVVLADAIGDDRRSALTDRGVEVLVTGRGGLRAGLATLAQRGVLDILCEGGATLAAALLEGGMISRVAVFVAPIVIGRGAPDLIAAPAVTLVADGRRLRDVEWSVVGDDALVNGVIESPAPGGSGSRET